MSSLDVGLSSSSTPSEVMYRIMEGLQRVVQGTAGRQHPGIVTERGVVIIVREKNVEPLFDGVQILVQVEPDKGVVRDRIRARRRRASQRVCPIVPLLP